MLQRVFPPPPTPKVAALNLISPADGALNQPLAPTFNWKVPAVIPNYHIQISTNNDLSNPIVNTDTITTTSYRYPNSLKFQTIYYWRVRAKNNLAFGLWSKQHSFITKK